MPISSENKNKQCKDPQGETQSKIAAPIRQHNVSRIMIKLRKRHVRPAKTQISLGIRRLIRVFAVRLMGS